MKYVSALSILLLGGFFLAFQVAVADKADTPSPEGQAAIPALTGELILREEQGGMGGTGIKSWTIAPDGKWSNIRYSIDTAGKEEPKTRRIIGSGTLSTERLAIVADIVQSQELLELPAVLGSKPKVNPHIYILQLGDKTSKLFGVPTQRSNSLKDHLIAWGPRDESTAVKRFATIAQAIVDACESPSVGAGTKKDPK